MRSRLRLPRRQPHPSPVRYEDLTRARFLAALLDDVTGKDSRLRTALDHLLETAGPDRAEKVRHLERTVAELRSLRSHRGEIQMSRYARHVEVMDTLGTFGTTSAAAVFDHGFGVVPPVRPWVQHQHGLKVLFTGVPWILVHGNNEQLMVTEPAAPLPAATAETALLLWEPDGAGELARFQRAAEAAACL